MNRQFQMPPDTMFEAQQQPQEQGVAIREALAFIWRHWIFVASIAGLSLLVGLVWLARAVPLYTATAQVMLDPQTDRAPVQNASSPTMFFLDPATMENQISLIRSDGLLARVVQKNKLYSVAPRREAPAPQEPSGFSWSGIKAALFGDSAPATPAETLPPEDEEQRAITAAVDRLRG